MRYVNIALAEPVPPQAGGLPDPKRKFFIGDGFSEPSLLMYLRAGAAVDPETFKIIDGKLYLYYNFFFNNTLKSWNEDEERLKAQADKNWSLLLNSKK